MCESPREGVCGATDFLLSKHELAQERLYRLWRAGWVREEHVLAWAQSMERLQREGDCDYLVWLLQRFPPLWESEDAESEGSLRGAGDAWSSEALSGSPQTRDRWDLPGTDQRVCEGPCGEASVHAAVAPS